jgi:transcriptional regulator with XRE-family HTH domain
METSVAFFETYRPPVLSERLKQAREAARLSQDDLAKRARVSRKSVGRYELGRSEPDEPTLERLAYATGVSPAFLAGHTDETAPIDPAPHRTPPRELTDGDIVHIQEIMVEAHAGEGTDPEAYALEVVNGQLRLPRWYIRAEYGVEPERVRQIRVRGDSMVPTLQPGQRLLVAIWEDSRIQDGLVYVLNGPGGVQIKRLYIEEEGANDHTVTYVRVWSDNAEAPRYRVTAERFDAEYRVVAVALEINRKL